MFNILYNIMKITPYGIFTGLALLISSSIININIKLIIIIIISIYLQSYLCYNCKNNYNLISFMAVLPLLVIIFYDYKNSYKLLLAFSIGIAIGRIGCFFAGCCTGKLTNKHNKLSIKYDKNYVINKNAKKNHVHVHPTIILEILFQFFIVYVMIKSKYPIIYFSILNIILIYLTKYWRYPSTRIKDKYITHITSISLFLLILISYFKYNKLKYNTKSKNIKYNVTYIKIILSIIFIIITSNDININNIKIYIYIYIWTEIIHQIILIGE